MPLKPFLNPRRAALENLCLKKLRDFGGRATAKQIADNLGKDLEVIGPRMSDLALAGRIRDTGERHHNGKGRPRVIWEVCDRTGEAVATLDATAYLKAPGWLERYGH